jgi:branched-chain amino acid transport system substrate-binding protein
MTDIVKAKAPKVQRIAILARNDLYPLALGQEFEKSGKKRGFRTRIGSSPLATSTT